MFNEVDTIIHFNTLFVLLIFPVLMLDATYIIIFIALGIGGGLFGSIIGVGGGIIFTPILTLIGLPPAQISSTSLMAVTFTSISSVISYARHRRIKYRIACRIALLSMPGAILGVYLSTMISIGLFKMFFSIILIIAVIYILFNGSTKNEKGKKKNSIQSLSTAILVCICSRDSIKSFRRRWRHNFCSYAININEYENVRSGSDFAIYYYGKCGDRPSYPCYYGQS